MIRINRGIGRQAFTLVELLVSLALIAFIMSILSAAFAAAAKTFSSLKAQGDLAERCRGVMTMLRRDLANQHFGSADPPLSQFAGPPNWGFFRIYQDQQIGVPPGPASWQVPQVPSPNEIPTFVSTRSMLHFSVTLPGAYPGDFFVTDLQTAFKNNPMLDPSQGYTQLFYQDLRYQPASTSVFKSQYAEVAWWLTPSLNPDNSQAFTATEPGQIGQPLYTLRRRQRLIWPEGPNPANGQFPTITPTSPNYDEVSAPGGGGPVQVNVMSQVTFPPNRFAMTPGAASPQGQPTDPINIYPNSRVGDIVVDGVLSFDVRILLITKLATAATATTPAMPAVMASTFVDLYDPSVQQYSNNNPYFSAATNGNPRVFDTWSNQKIPPFDYSAWATPGTNASIPLWKNAAAGQIIQIQAIQVTLRLYDFKSQTTRQVSMVQAM